MSASRRNRFFAAILLIVCAAVAARAQSRFYAIGADVSYLAQCERDGVVFREDGQPRDVLAMLAEHHYNWARLRLFVDPARSPDRLPNDLAYTLALARRAHAMGFHLLLDLHYSDSWADPDKQTMPAAWRGQKHKQLVETVHDYTRDVIARFRAEGVMPDMVQVGNEITQGMLWPDGKLPDNWDNLADLLRAGIRGIDDGRGTARRPLIMIHIERSGSYEAAQWYYDTLIAHHVTFDVIGLSYYPFWHGPIARMRANLHDLAIRYHMPIIVVETAFNWKPAAGATHHFDFPESPAGQLEELKAVDAAVRAIPGGLGWGVFWWEPAAEHELGARSFFDDQGNVLPVIRAFDSAPAAQGPVSSPASVPER